MAVPIDWMGTASVAPVMAPPVRGMQKLPRQVGKWFIRFIADIQYVLNVPKDLPWAGWLGHWHT
jgi:hypothetical protein